MKDINEAFVSVPLIAIKALKLDLHGSTSNPIGASGGRLAATVISELQKRKARYGLATLYVGGAKLLPPSLNGRNRLLKINMRSPGCKA